MIFRKKKAHKHRMRISFDLDEVLFVDPATHKTEPPPAFPLNLLYKERLRAGTPELIRRLQKMGLEVFVYTSSFRPERYIRRLFSLYGVHFDDIINGERHQREVQHGHAHPMPVKLPSKYKIKLHIDDEPILSAYGRTYGFDVFLLSGQDDEWQEKIIARIEYLRKREQRRTEHAKRMSEERGARADKP